jgi:hypothetical protein
LGGYLSIADVAAPNNDIIPVSLTNADSTGNDFLDAILSSGLTKTILGTDTGILPDFTSGNNVAIGEMITYEISIDLLEFHLIM